MNSKLPVLFFLIIFYCIRFARGCHSAEDAEEDSKRRKRQAQQPSAMTAENTQTIRSYFSNCLLSEVGEIWDWQSVIDTTILDTFWYENTGDSNCSAGIDDDTPDCWISRLNDYLSRESFLRNPASDCINQFSSDTDRGIAANSAQIFAAGIAENANRAPLTCQVETAATEPYLPNAPEVRQYSVCGRELTIREPSRQPIDYPTLIQFVQQHTICSAELVGCNNQNQETISQGDPDVPRWPYRFEALLKTSSPLRTVIENCNERVYPVRTDWTSWGECSVTCGGGTRTRTRECTDSGCVTMETETCSDQNCPGCSISMFSRRQCGDRGITQEACLQRPEKCCFSQGNCYRANKESDPPPNGPCRPRDTNLFGLGLSYRPTPASLMSSGGEDGFPGSRTQLECNEAKAAPCGSKNMRCSSCSRLGCCWSDRLRRCYSPAVTVVEVREKCSNGFENPPACTDINDCNSSSCLNGGTCNDLIQGFSCSCLPQFSGPRCEIGGIYCYMPPLPENGGDFVPTNSNNIYILGNTITYRCELGFVASNAQVKNTCLGNGTWSLSSPPLCIGFCAMPPVPINGYVSNVMDKYMEGATVDYFCYDGYFFKNLSAPHSNNCTGDGTWSNDAPTCSMPSCTLRVAADLAFVIDGSGSVSGSFELLRSFVYEVVREFRNIGADQIRVAIIQYSSSPRVELTFDQSSNRDEVLDVIKNINFLNGGTNTGQALEYLNNHMFNQSESSVPRVAVVITDGGSSDNVATPALNLRNQGVIMYAVGVSNAIQSQLIEIASSPSDDHVLNVNSFPEITFIKTQLVEKLCAQLGSIPN